MHYLLAGPRGSIDCYADRAELLGRIERERSAGADLSELRVLGYRDNGVFVVERPAAGFKLEQITEAELDVFVSELLELAAYRGRIAALRAGRPATPRPAHLNGDSGLLAEQLRASLAAQFELIEA